MAITSKSYVLPDSSSRTGDANRLKPSLLIGNSGRGVETGSEVPFGSGVLLMFTGTGVETLDG